MAKPLSPALSGRFFLVSTLPTAAGAVFVLVLLWAGAPDPVRFERAWRTAAGLKAGEVLLLVLSLTLVGVVTMPLQLSLVRWLEGYWPRWLGWPAAWCTALQKRRRGPLGWPYGSAVPSAALVQRAGERGAWQRSRFPVEDHLLRPTGLGNALTAAERRAGRLYGLDAVVVWTRLEPVLSDRVRAAVAEGRDALDAAARLCVTAGAVVPVSAALLWRSEWWLLLALAPAVICWAAYAAAVHAAVAYGEVLAVAFDLHRFDLLTALHLPLPDDRAAERTANAELSRLWRQGAGSPAGMVYDHPPQPAEPVSPPQPPQPTGTPGGGP
ncbi:hypothetical protein [Streptomyces coffeae]|uniref:Uncharacterized protein n=1 Tax=Streptomyces coffeae TaxID=621382 RepID=A0ABS1NL46_9ACTN|nr:hypothetical protein [Streptomyces coffeae]MBL1100680.1 hypothetical protein [Streptomyces coffeae]